MKTMYTNEVELNANERIGMQHLSSLRRSRYRLGAPAALIARAGRIGLLAMLLGCASWLAHAQTIPPRQALGPEVTIVADRSAVRFATLEGTPITRLKVYTQTGEQIFDSGVIASPALECPLSGA